MGAFQSSANATSHPAQSGTTDERNQEYFGQFTHVMNNRTVNELKVGYSHYGFRNELLTTWSKHWQAPRVTNGHPRITFTGFTIAGNANYPRHRDQRVWFVRDDFTFSYDAGGRHDLKVGGEWVRHFEDSENCNRCGGEIDARGGPLPSAANLQAWFPDPFDTDSWNLAAISPITRFYTIGVGTFPLQYAQPKYAAWGQDDWRISDRLTLNLGLRYDLSLNSWANDVGVPLLYDAGRPNDVNNVQPRVGFAYQFNDRTVVRGGSGLYYSDALTVDAFWPYYNAQLGRIQISNDGRANFASDPLNGQPVPSFDQAQTRFCDSQAQAAVFAAWRASNYAGAAPCLLNSFQEIPAPEQYMKMARSWQTSIGVQRQFGSTTAVEADYIYTQGRNEKETVDNVNLGYNSATGENYPYATSRSQPCAAAVPAVRHHLNDPAQHPVGFALVADRFHQEDESALAVLRDLHAVGLLGCTESTIQWSHDCAIRSCARFGKRFTLGPDRSAPSCRLQRYLAGRPWLPGQRLPLLRRRHSERDQLRG